MMETLFFTPQVSRFAFMHKLQRGFSLVELLVVIMITGILLAIAVPNMQKFYNRTLMNRAIDEMLMMIMTARTEAVRQGISVTLCRANNAAGNFNPNTSCSTTGAGTGPGGFSRTSNDWGLGMIMFAETAGNKGVRATTETILRRVNETKSFITILEASGSVGAMTFNAQGQLEGNDNNGKRFGISYGDATDDRSICISRGGSVRIIDFSASNACQQ